MTSEEAYLVAAELLDQRGQLLNGQLFRLVHGDKDLFREVRDRLVQNGIAEDRSGVGLVRSESEGEQHWSDESSFVRSGTPHSQQQLASIASSRESDIETAADWWLMQSGDIQGPMSLLMLCQLRRRGELLDSDVVRQGVEGLWRSPDDFPILASARPTVAPVTKTYKTLPPSGSFVPVEKEWQIRQKRGGNVLLAAWNVAAGIVGGTKRLKALLLGLMIFALLAFWWQLPPSASTIYNEFTSCRATFKKLQDRRAKRADWDDAVVRYKPRVEYLLKCLKPWATDKHPLEQALYSAGVQGVLHVVESPGSFNDPDPAYDKLMKNARDLLDGVNPQ